MEEKLSKDNVKNFIEGNLNYYLSVDKHIIEQALYRAKMCPTCLRLGHCVKCKCPTPKMFFAPNKVDPDKKWGKMLNSEEWDKFKENNLPKFLQNEISNKANDYLHNPVRESGEGREVASNEKKDSNEVHDANSRTQEMDRIKKSSSRNGL